MISDTENSRWTTVIFPGFIRGRNDHARHGYRCSSEEIDETEETEADVSGGSRGGGNGREDGTQVREGREATKSDAQVPALADPSRRLWSGVARGGEDSGALADGGGEDAL